MSHEEDTTMVNIGSHPVRISISHGPQRRPSVTVVEPGESAEFPTGYCEPVKGAGRHVLASIIERKSMRDGKAQLVPAGDPRATAIARSRRAPEPEPSMRAPTVDNLDAFTPAPTKKTKSKSKRKSREG